MTETTTTAAPVKESSMKKKEPRFILSPSSCFSHSGASRARVSNVRRCPAPCLRPLDPASALRYGSPSGDSGEYRLPGVARRGRRPDSLLATRHPRGLRVTRTNGTPMVLESPVVRADTLSGLVSRDGGQQQVQIPLAD